MPSALVLVTVWSGLSPVRAAERDQGIDWGSLLGGVAWVVVPILVFMATVWLGIRALRARNDMTETDTY